MKILKMLTAGILLLVPLQVSALEKDKQLHLGVSTVIGASVQYVYEDTMTTMLICTGVGLGKELYDEVSYGGFDTEDLIYDVIGCGIGAVVGDYGVKMFKHQDAIGIGYEFKF